VTPEQAAASRGRILMLVPHDPDLDPRVRWVIDLCRGIARTDVIAATFATTKPVKEYDGVVAIERVDALLNAAPLARRLSSTAGRLDLRLATQEFKQHQGRSPGGGLRPRLRHHLGALFRLVSAWAYYSMLMSALYRRAKAAGVPPSVIVAHDIYALIPAALLKRRFSCSLLYDSHEYFPHGDLLAPAWQVRLTRALERRFIGRADVVVTVSPPLARQLEADYGIRGVLSVANAEPRSAAEGERAELPKRTGPVRFLLQGQAAPGRGFERLFELWERLADERAILQVRCPDWEYPAELRSRYASLFESSRAVWLPAVAERDLVSAAAQADVGVIPYVGPNLNHIYACPNKLSQYMAGGLAILTNDLEFVASVVRRFDCGVVYRADEEQTFVAALEALLGDPLLLERFKANALDAARTEYSWEVESRPYERELRRLAGVSS
jgi:glycosyltransferase involved in cell wall biosynthesis